MEEPFNILSNIEEVEVPPFLFARIQHKIQYEAQNKLSPAFAYTLGFSFLMIIMLNVAVIMTKRHHSALENHNIAQTMDLLPNNSLYK